ncbi:MAG: hypothetical protein MI919_16280, partial [Holophagales bacterium]|nr:hypothetical protein [Holophagales bacterium]
ARNNGPVLDAGTEYRWELIRAGESVPTELVSGTLPVLPETGFHTVTDTLPAGQLPGDYEVRFTIDPGRLISERTRENNSVTVPLEVRSHPAGIDLSISSDDLVASPPEVAAVPQPVTVAGVVRNVGLTGASGAVVAIYDGVVAPERRLGTALVDVGPLGTAPFAIDVALGEARPYELVAVADPDRLLADADRFDNAGTVRLLLRLRTDLEVAALTADPTAGEVGQAVTLRATVMNGGTEPVADFQLAFTFVDEGATERLIRLLSVAGELAPGASVEVETEWLPNLSGALTLAAEVDPQDTLGDEEPADDRLEIPFPVGGSALTNLRVLPENLVLSPSPPLQGQSAEVQITIENPTANPAPAFSAELWLDQVGGILLASGSFPGLAAGTTVDLVGNWNVELPGDRLIYAVVDPAGEVAEFTEEDNEAFTTVDVQTLPDLQLASGGVHFTPDFPRVGDVVHFDVEVRNGGDQASPSSVLELLDAAGAVLDSVSIPPMAGHTELVLGLDWDPGGEAGEFPLSVRANGAGAFAELDAGNNRAFFTVAVQDGDLYVANQIFSPNGDGVRDTATFFFRTQPAAVEIRDRDDRVVRSLAVPPGAESVVWDGVSDRGNLARDGVYRVRLDDGVGDIETWVAVDNNLFAVTSELDQRLLVGFLEPQLPGFGEERSRFDSMVSNPLFEEIYAVERLVSDITGETSYTLRRFVGDEMVEIGPYPPDGAPLISASAAGDAFTVGYGGGQELLRYPGPVRQALLAPEEYSWTPWISPDGRWVLWASSEMDGVVLEDPDGTLGTHPFDAGPFAGYGPCGGALRAGRRRPSGSDARSSADRTQSRDLVE